jgi:hypothetical protein
MGNILYHTVVTMILYRVISMLPKKRVELWSLASTIYQSADIEYLLYILFNNRISCQYRYQIPKYADKTTPPYRPVTRSYNDYRKIDITSYP